MVEVEEGEEEEGGPERRWPACFQLIAGGWGRVKRGW